MTLVVIGSASSVFSSGSESIKLIISCPSDSLSSRIFIIICFSVSPGAKTSSVVDEVSICSAISTTPILFIITFVTGSISVSYVGRVSRPVCSSFSFASELFPASFTACSSSASSAKLCANKSAAYRLSVSSDSSSSSSVI